MDAAALIAHLKKNRDTFRGRTTVRLNRAKAELDKLQANPWGTPVGPVLAAVNEALLSVERVQGYEVTLFALEQEAAKTPPTTP